MSNDAPRTLSEALAFAERVYSDNAAYRTELARVAVKLTHHEWMGFAELLATPDGEWPEAVLAEDPTLRGRPFTCDTSYRGRGSVYYAARSAGLTKAASAVLVLQRRGFVLVANADFSI